MNIKRLVGWLIAVVFTAVVTLGIPKLLEMESLTKSMILIVIGIITIVVALVGLDKILRKSFFVSGMVIINFAIGYSWNNITGVWKIISVVVILLEVFYVLYLLYLRTGNKVAYTHAVPSIVQKQLSGAQIHINDFCKSKYHSKDDVDACMARLLGGGQS